MKMKMKRNLDAFVEKLSSVHDFKSFYAQEKCLIKAAILEPEDTTNKKYALIRVFVDLESKKQSYVIFINDKEAVTFIDLISESSEKIIEKHLAFSPEQSVTKAGSLQTGETIKLSKGDDLAAALLWAVDLKTNLDPKNGLETVQKLLDPTF